MLLSISSSPTGPFHHLRELNPRDSHHLPRIAAQSNGVFRVELEGGKEQLIWSGDMWQSSLSGRKGADVQVHLLRAAAKGVVPIPVSLDWGSIAQVWLPLDVHSNQTLTFTREWELGPLAMPVNASFPPSRVQSEFATLVKASSIT